MSLDEERYDRAVYSIFDYISDLGGLSGAITPIIFGVVTFLNYQSIYQFLMGDLYVIKNATTGNYELEENDV